MRGWLFGSGGMWPKFYRESKHREARLPDSGKTKSPSRAKRQQKLARKRRKIVQRKQRVRKK